MNNVVKNSNYTSLSNFEAFLDKVKCRCSYHENYICSVFISPEALVHQAGYGSSSQD
jgi:hypothetical protein